MNNTGDLGHERQAQLNQAHQALAAGDGTILLAPTARAGTSADIAAARLAIYTDETVLIDRFDEGALALIPHGDIEIIIILATNEQPPGSGAPQRITALVCDDPVDADHQYAHVAEILGVLSGACGGCSQPIPSVFEYCRKCV